MRKDVINSGMMLRTSDTFILKMSNIFCRLQAKLDYIILAHVPLPFVRAVRLKHETYIRKQMRFVLFALTISVFWQAISTNEFASIYLYKEEEM